MTDRDGLFGDDLRLRDTTGGLDLVDVAGDLALAHGADNIAQALRLRLMVRQGELAPLGWPDYGSRLHELIGQPSVARTHARAMALARAAVEADPRVDEVLRIHSQAPPGERDLVRLELDVLLVSETTPLNLVVDVRLA